MNDPLATSLLCNRSGIELDVVQTCLAIKRALLFLVFGSLGPQNCALQFIHSTEREKNK